MSISDELRLTIVGTTGCGLSSTANTILSKSHFKSKVSARSVTTKTKKGKAVHYIDLDKERIRKKIIVHDNPGLHCTELSKINIFKEIKNSIFILCPGPHAILYVIRIGRLPYNEAESIRMFKELFGRNVFPFVIVVFTHKNALGDEDFEQYVKSLPNQIQSFLGKCELGRIALDNFSTQFEKEEARKEILDRIIFGRKTENMSFFHMKYMEPAPVDKIKNSVLCMMDNLKDMFQRITRLRKKLLLLFVMAGSLIFFTLIFIKPRLSNEESKEHDETNRDLGTRYVNMTK